MEWFKNLSEPWQIAIITVIVPVALFAVGGLIKWLFSKKNPSSAPVNEIDQPGSDNTAIITENNKGNIATGDINTGIDIDEVLNGFIEISKKIGYSEQENKRLKQTITQLEEQLATPQRSTETGESQTPLSSQEAKDLAAQIDDDAGPYAQALKAIAEGDNEQADKFLDETQQFLDAVHENKDRAQAKIYYARMHKAFIASEHRDALQYCEKLQPLAGDDPMILNLMATVYHENALFQKAEPLFKRAMTIDEASYGRDHPDVARDLNNLAQLYRETNRLKEAEPLMKRALTIDEASLGKDHPKVARDLNNLAQLYKAMNRLAEAEPLMKRALAIDEASFGKDHPNVATDLNNLAQLYKATNRLTDAELLMIRVLAIDEASLGKDHPNVSMDLNNLAQLYQATNRLKEAEPLMMRALAIDEASFGKDHPTVATRLNNLAQLYQVTNRLAEAEPLYARAIKILESILGSDHPSTVTIRKNRDICRGIENPSTSENNEECQ